MGILLQEVKRHPIYQTDPSGLTCDAQEAAAAVLTDHPNRRKRPAQGFLHFEPRPTEAGVVKKSGNGPRKPRRQPESPTGGAPRTMARNARARNQTDRREPRNSLQLYR